METRPRPTTRTILKMPSIPRSRWPVTANNHHAENSDHRACAAADARDRAAIPATTATETARPMVPGGLDGERQVLRTGLRQRAGPSPQERLVSGRLARERQLLHPLRAQLRASWHHRHFKMIAKPAEVPSGSRSLHDGCSPRTTLAATNNCGCDEQMLGQK